MGRLSDRPASVSDDTADMVLVCLDGVWVLGMTVKVSVPVRQDHMTVGRELFTQNHNIVTVI